MTQSPAGWYPEPDPNHVGPPGRLRYWDGSAWTEHVHDPQAQVSPPPAYPSADPSADPSAGPSAGPSGAGFAPIGGGQPAQPTYQPTPAYPAQPQTPYGQQPYPAGPYGQAAPQYAPAYPSTPDGQRLAGWWQRALAVLLDALIQIPLILLASVPVFVAQWNDLTDWWETEMDAARSGVSANNPMPDIFDPTTGAGLAVILISAGVSFLYSAGFLRWKQATPGKLMLGLQVRRRDVAGPLPWSTILARVGFVAALSLLTNVPLLGILALIAILVDYLNPLWDGKKQALHDKVAGTNVVRTR